MNKTTEALKLAEEALNKYQSVLGLTNNQQDAKALATIREALAEQEKQRSDSERMKPDYVGWYCAHCERGVDASEVTFHEQHEVCGRVISNDVPPKPVKQEPVAWVYRGHIHEFDPSDWAEGEVTPLYAAPVDAKAIRAEALEEAAKVCDSVNNYDNPMTALDCAAAIRGLK